MKKLLLLPFLLIGVSISAQTAKPDSTYRLQERDIIQISQLLDYGLKAAGNSAQISTRDYNEFARQVAKIDSLFRKRYSELHQVKAKKDQK